MQTRIASLLLACTLLLASHAALAADRTAIRPGVTYTGQARLAAPEAGVGFTLPAGFQGGLPQGTEMFIMAPASGAGRILMSADRFTVAQASATMAQPIDLGDGVRLLPRSAPTTAGRRIHGQYTVIGGGQALVAEVDTVVGPHGIGVAMIAVAPAPAMPTLRQALALVRRSLAFEPPTTTATAENPASAPTAGALQLSGVRLLRFYNGSGYAEKTVLHLCSDGSFRRNFNASSVTSLGSGVAADGSAGRYSVRGNQLVLQYHDGTHAAHTVQVTEGKLLLDGKRWYREHQDCR